MEKYEGIRKVLAGVVILAVGIVIATLRDDIPANLLQLMEVIFGGFIVGNATEHVVGAVTARADAHVEVARINAEAAEPEPWDDNFAALEKLVSDHDAKAQQNLQDIKAAIAAALEHSEVSTVAEAKQLAAVHDMLVKATTPAEGTAEAFDYAGAVKSLMTGMAQVQEAQQINSKALSLILSRTE